MQRGLLNPMLLEPAILNGILDECLVDVSALACVLLIAVCHELLASGRERKRWKLQKRLLLKSRVFRVGCIGPVFTLVAQMHPPFEGNIDIGNLHGPFAWVHCGRLEEGEVTVTKGALQPPTSEAKRKNSEPPSCHASSE